MVNGLCFVASPYPNSNSSIMSHFKGMVRLVKHALMCYNVVQLLYSIEQ